MKQFIAFLIVLIALVSSGLSAAAGGGTPGDVVSPLGLYEEWIEIPT